MYESFDQISKRNDDSLGDYAGVDERYMGGQNVSFVAIVIATRERQRSSLQQRLGRYRIQICSFALPGNRDCQISCCSKWHTQNFTSPRPCGQSLAKPS